MAQLDSSSDTSICKDSSRPADEQGFCDKKYSLLNNDINAINLSLAIWKYSVVKYNTNNNWKKHHEKTYIVNKLI